MQPSGARRRTRRSRGVRDRPARGRGARRPSRGGRGRLDPGRQLVPRARSSTRGPEPAAREPRRPSASAAKSPPAPRPPSRTPRDRRPATTRAQRRAAALAAGRRYRAPITSRTRPGRGAPRRAVPGSAASTMVEHVVELGRAAVVRVGYVGAVGAGSSSTAPSGRAPPRPAPASAAPARSRGPAPGPGRTGEPRRLELPGPVRADRRSRARAASRGPARSAASPACQPPVPALSISTACASPASSTWRRNTASAIGDRQMLPMQTKQTRYAMPPSCPRPAPSTMSPPPSSTRTAPGRTRPRPGGRRSRPGVGRAMRSAVADRVQRVHEAVAEEAVVLRRALAGVRRCAW